MYFTSLDAIVVLLESAIPVPTAAASAARTTIVLVVMVEPPNCLLIRDPAVREQKTGSPALPEKKASARIKAIRVPQMNLFFVSGMYV
jgi:hypothetical protein